MTINYSPDRVIYGKTGLTPSFAVEKFPRSASTESDGSEVTFGDGKYKWRTIIGDSRLDARFIPSIPCDAVITSMDPSIYLVDSEGVARMQNQGTTFFQCDTNFGRFFTAPVTNGGSAGSSFYKWVFQSHVDGTFAKSISANVLSRIAGITPAPRVNGFHPQASIYTSNVSPFTRNSRCWLNDIDLGFHSVEKSAPGGRFTLIGSDVALIATHYLPGVDGAIITSGYTVTFRASNGTLVTRTVSGTNSIAGSDISVVRFSSSVSGVTPIRLAPSTLYTVVKGLAGATTPEGQPYSTYANDPLTDYCRMNNISAVAMDSSLRVWPVDLLYGNTFNSRATPNKFIAPEPNNGRYEWKADSLFNATEWQMGPGGQSTFPTNEWWFGDSSSPLFYLDASGPVLLGVASTFTASSEVWKYITQINTAISALGSSASVTYGSISGFPTFA